MLHVIEDSVMDSVKLIPFLFVAYLVMEYLEHRTGEQARKLLAQPDGNQGTSQRSHSLRKFISPVMGGLFGIVPQCGFSAAAANLYAGGLISLGTLMAVYLSTSDEMLPILLSERVPMGMILQLLLAKAAIGILAGLVIDLLYRHVQTMSDSVHDFCEQEHCHCEKGILRSALAHTVKIALFLLAVNFTLNLILHFMGEDVLANLLLDKPVLGPLLASLVGLIPNCAGSVVITQLYLAGSMGLGAAIAGLLTGSGIGLLVLFRVNHHRKENLIILGLLYGIGATAGILIELFL